MIFPDQQAVTEGMTSASGENNVLSNVCELRTVSNKVSREKSPGRKTPGVNVCHYGIRVSAGVSEGNTDCAL